MMPLAQNIPRIVAVAVAITMVKAMVSPTQVISSFLFMLIV
jgi:hypothetical protein